MRDFVRPGGAMKSWGAKPQTADLGAYQSSLRANTVTMHSRIPQTVTDALLESIEARGLSTEGVAAGLLEVYRLGGTFCRFGAEREQSLRFT